MPVPTKQINGLLGGPDHEIRYIVAFDASLDEVDVFNSLAAHFDLSADNLKEFREQEKRAKALRVIRNAAFELKEALSNSDVSISAETMNTLGYLENLNP